MRKPFLMIPLLVFISAAAFIPAHAKDDYLRPQEIDDIRDEQDAGKRIILYLSFAQHRLDDVRSSEVSNSRKAGQDIQKSLDEYNSIMGAIDESIADARKQRAMLTKPLEELKAQGTAFLRFLHSLQTDGPNRSDYLFTLEEAIDATQDELNAAKEGPYPELKNRKPPSDLPPAPPPPPKNSGDE